MVPLVTPPPFCSACEKVLPFVLGGVLVCVILFGLYVRSVPPKEKKRIIPPTPPGAVPEFMNINVDPKPGKKAGDVGEGGDADRAALDEAMRLLQEKGINVNAATVTKGEGEKEGEEVQEL